MDFILLDKAFQLKILIADIIIRFENENEQMGDMILDVKNQDDIIDKIKGIRRNYKQLLLNEECFRDREMINIIFKKINNEGVVNDKRRMLSYMSDSDSEDLDIISYNSWLKNK